MKQNLYFTKGIFLFCLFFSISITSYAHFNDWKEYFTVYGNKYDETKAKELANKKKNLLTNSMSFYDAQILFVDTWIGKSKCKVAKENLDEHPTSAKAIELILFFKMFMLSGYEENLSAECTQVLNNKAICSEAKNKLKADKVFLPVFVSLKERLVKEKDMINSVINEEDSVILKFNAKSNHNLGLSYIDKSSYGSTTIKYNWYKELDDNILNSLPTVYGEIQEKNPDYNPIAGKWAWLNGSDYDRVRTTYPVEEIYKKYESHPEYKVKTIDKRDVVYLNDEVVFIEKGKDKHSELVRQVCIVDYNNNKYDIKKSSPSLLAKIDEMLIEGKDRYYYAGCEMACNMARTAFNKMMQIKKDKSMGGVMLNAMVNVPEPSDEEIKEFEARLAILEADVEKAKQFDKDPEYKVAENYISQLKSDREDLKFKPQRIDGLSYLYTSSDGKFKVKMTMEANGKSIKETYSLVQ